MASSDGRRATFEHVVPRALGGSNLIGNLAISCYDCNNRRGMQMCPEHIEVLAMLGEAWAQGGQHSGSASDFNAARINPPQAPDRAVPLQRGP